MELKIVCQCGQKYKFDVEPVNGRMPYTINCPVCNQDGTFTANMKLAEILPNPPPPPVTTSPAASVIEPPPPPLSPTTSSSGGLRLSRSATAPAPPTDSTGTEENISAPAPIRPLRSTAPTATAQKPKKTPNFGMGLLGGFIGAFVGVVIYYLVFKFTGLRIKLLAIGVGALAGWLAEFMSKGEGSKELGGITAVFVIGGLIGAQYLVTLGWWHEFHEAEMKAAAAMYDESVTEAKEVVKEVPTGSDAEIRAYMVHQAAKDGDKLAPSEVSNDDVSFFRKSELPEYQALASGQMTREQFETSHQLKTHETDAERNEEDKTFKGLFMLFLLSKLNLFSLVAAAGLAFKMSTNA